MKKKYPIAYTVLLVVFMLLSNFYDANAQINIKDYVNPAPPNIASFEKYGNTPINYSTGQVSQNINLYTLDIDANIKIPIDLTYSNSGMKPDDIPSWVGHGWDLMPGGYILQQINGIDDLLPGGLRHDPGVRIAMQNYINFVTSSSTDRYYYIQSVLRGNTDTQPDVFSLNLFGKMTKFYFDGTTVKFIKQEPYKIELQSAIGFIVTDEKGYKFYFLNSIANSGTSVTDPNGYAPTGGSRTWNLDKITTPDNEVVSFQYTGDGIYMIRNTNTSYTFGPSDIVDDQSIGYHCVSSTKGPIISESATTVAQSILKSISYKGRTINFGTVPRNDITTEFGSVANALTSIQVLNENNESVKLIQFGYDNNLRLRLDQVSILDNVTQASIQRYGFEYYGALTSIPLITSAQRTYDEDYWGYYNGGGNSLIDIPNIDYSTLVPGLTGQLGHNNNRPNENLSIIGMLHRINYPAGGYTEIDYETNQLVYNDLNGLGNPYVDFINRPISTDILFASTNCAEGAPGSTGGTGGGGFETGYFTINNYMYNVNVTWGFTSSTGTTNSCKIERIENGKVVETIIDKAGSNVQQLEYHTFAPGTYQYTLNAACDEATTANSVLLKVSGTGLPPEGLIARIGGNRVLRIRDFEKSGVVANVRKFQYSGTQLNQAPKYIDTYGVISEPQFGTLWPHITCGPVYTIGNRNLTPQLSFPVTYRQVTELLGENGENGKNIYYYGSPVVIAGDYANSPYPPAVPLSWRDNDLLKKEVYKNAGASFVKKESTSYVYTPFPLPFSSSPGILQGVNFGVKGVVLLGNEQPEHYTEYFNSGSVILPTDRYAVAEQVDTTFNDSGTITVDRTTKSYTTNDFLLSSTLNTSSSGQPIENKIWYPNDFNDNVTNVSTLKANNMIGLPLKTIVNRSGNTISGEVYTRDNKGNITENYNYENINHSGSLAHDPSVYYPQSFVLKNSFFYNDRVREYKQANGASTTVLWCYTSSYPLAEIKNATYQQVLDVLGQTVIDRLNSASPGSDAEINTMLAPLRTDSRLKDASVKTYIYDPLVGITSSTDEKGMIVYYEYDGFKRLKSVKDQNGNVIKNYNYNYRGS